MAVRKHQTKGRHLPAAVLLALAAAVGSVGAAEPGPGFRLAVIVGEGEREPAEALVAEIEVELSKQPGIALVERERIRGVLAEQKLTLAGLTDAGTALKVGQLLAADAFLFAETWRQGAAAPCLLRVAESRTGITLDSLATAEAELTRDSAPLLALVRQAQAKARVPPRDRRYVGLLGFRSEEPGRALDGLAEALGAFLMADLAPCPNIIPLDREHLSQLTDEAKLAALDLELKTAAVLVDGGLRRGGNAGELAVTVDLRRPGGGTSQRLQVTVPAGDLNAARQALVAEVARVLAVGDVAAPPADPASEAGVFRRQAELLISWGENAAAVRAAEAAYALNPDQPARTLATKAWNYTKVQIWGYARERFDTLTPTDQFRALSAALRERTLIRELYGVHAQRFEEGKEAEIVLPYVIPSGEWRGAAVSSDAAVVELENQLAALDDDIGRFRIEFYRKHYHLPAAQSAYWSAWAMQPAPGVLDPGRADLLARRVRRLVDAFANPPGETLGDEALENRLSMVSSWTEPLQLIRAELNPPRAADRGLRAADCAVMTALCRDLAQHPDPSIRLAALNGLLCLGVDEEVSARALLQTVVDSFPPGHAYRRSTSTGRLNNLVYRAVVTLAHTKPADADGYCRQILGPYLDAGDAAHLRAWESTVSEWLQSLARCGKTQEANALATAILAVSRSAAGNPGAVAAQGFVREVEATQAALATTVGTSGPGASAWDGYGAQPIDLGWGRVFPRVHVAGDRLYLVRDAGERLSDAQKEQGEGLLSVDILTLPDGRRKGSLGDLVLPPRTPLGWPVLDSVLAKSALYVATSTGLYRFGLDGKRPEPVRQITEALGTDIKSLAWLDGRLYLGLGTAHEGRSGLACYNPRTGSAELIACSTAMEVRSGLDGGTSYRIDAMLGDPGRHCLWLGVVTTEGWDRHGVWRYDALSNKIDRPFAGGQHDRLDHIVWAGNRILGHATPSGLVLYDPEAGTKTWLLAGHPDFRPAGCEAPLFREGGVDTWPALYDGEILITGGRGALYLHREGASPSPHPAISAVSALEQTPYGVLAVSNEPSRAWLLRRQPGPAHTGLRLR